MAYDLYQELILHHYRNPKNFGPLPVADLDGADSNPTCGDHIEVRLKLDPDRRMVEEIRFTGDGCAISVASTSLLTVQVAGKSLEEVRAITRDDVLKQLGIPLSPVRLKCALTGFAALGKALHSSGPSTNPPTAQGA